MSSRLNPEAFASALAWICDDQGTPFGAGTLVGRSYVLTCAHVVKAALKLNTQDPPLQPVQVIFTHASDHRPRLAAVRRDRWFPRADSSVPEPSADDMALLVLLEDPPPDATPVPRLLSGAAQEAAGCRIGADYPAPVVDHAAARQRTLQRFGVLKRKPADG